VLEVAVAVLVVLEALVLMALLVQVVMAELGLQ
jgi:hypothetical protein